MDLRDEWAMCCPSCGTGRLSITFTGTCELTFDGAEDVGDHEWDGKSPCSCVECNWEGLVREASQAYEELGE